MWRIQKKEKFDIWENDLCSLKVQYEENKCRVYVNYKGYNVVIPMGMYGFEDEIQERKIKYEANVPASTLSERNAMCLAFIYYRV